MEKATNDPAGATPPEQGAPESAHTSSSTGDPRPPAPPEPPTMHEEAQVDDALSALGACWSTNNYAEAKRMMLRFVREIQSDQLTALQQEHATLKTEKESDAWHRGWKVAVAERDEARAVANWCDDAACGLTVSDFALSFTPVRRVEETHRRALRAEADLATLQAEHAALCETLEATSRECATLRADQARLVDLLKRINGWDHMDSAADGPFWRREIAAALRLVAARPSDPSRAPTDTKGD